MSKKYFHVYGKTTIDDGSERIVTIVGKFEQTRKKKEIKEDTEVELLNGNFIRGELKYNVKMLNRKLTLGMSICHPYDKFDEEIGVEIAKRRIEQGQDLGSIETNDVTMLTEDAIFAEMMTKLNHVLNNMKDYIPMD